MKSLASPLAIALHEVGHSFAGREVFSGISIHIEPGSEVLIRGINGSGKSTLGSILAGELTPLSGSVQWAVQDTGMDAESVLRWSARVGPGTELHPDLTVNELLSFQSKFRGWHPQIDPQSWISDAGLLERARQKQFRTLSSGMQQRVKLTCALASDARLIVLDEPCANLDARGKAWYQELRKATAGSATIIVCSNDRKEDFISPAQTFSLEKSV